MQGSHRARFCPDPPAPFLALDSARPRIAAGLPRFNRQTSAAKSSGRTHATGSFHMRHFLSFLIETPRLDISLSLEEFAALGAP